MKCISDQRERSKRNLLTEIMVSSNKILQPGKEFKPKLQNTHTHTETTTAKPQQHRSVGDWGESQQTEEQECKRENERATRTNTLSH